MVSYFGLVKYFCKFESNLHSPRYFTSADFVNYDFV